ncbi:MAG: hypothetical protein ACI94Y_002735 [Maribacter sp.]|jgi:hypothetical protein
MDLDNMIQIKAVSSKKDQKAFIHFPWKVYQGDPHWVPPLIMDFKQIFSPKHPFYEYGTMQHLLAYKDGEVAGRITAITNSLHEKHQDKITGFIGFFECIDDQAVANALLDEASRILKEKGYQRIHGPANPSINYDYGLLIDGFDDSPRIMMTYNPKYYIRLLENYGFNNIKNLFAYRLDIDKAVAHPKLERVAKLVQKRYNVKLRPINMKNIDADIEVMKEIYAVAWENNWGDVPMTTAEFGELAKAFKPLAIPELIQYAYVDDKPVALIVGMPDWYEVMKTMNGRLFPFNFLKIFTKKNTHKWGRVIIMGTLPEYRSKGLDGLLCYTVLKEAQKRNIKFAEGSWILEDNVMMNRAMKNFFGEVYKTYAIFEKEI